MVLRFDHSNGGRPFLPHLGLGQHALRSLTTPIYGRSCDLSEFLRFSPGNTTMTVNPSLRRFCPTNCSNKFAFKNVPFDASSHPLTNIRSKVSRADSITCDMRFKKESSANSSTRSASSYLDLTVGVAVAVMNACFVYLRLRRHQQLHDKNDGVQLSI